MLHWVIFSPRQTARGCPSSLISEPWLSSFGNSVEGIPSQACQKGKKFCVLAEVKWNKKKKKKTHKTKRTSYKEDSLDVCAEKITPKSWMQ